MDVKISNRALSLLALCFIVVYLWPFHPHPYGGFISDWLALLGILIFCAFHLFQSKIPVRLPWVSAIPLGLALIILIQTSLGMLVEPWDAVLPIAYLCMAALAMILGAGLASEEQNGAARLCAALAGAHLFAGLVSVAIAAVQFVHADPAFGVLIFHQAIKGAVGATRPTANIAQPNQLALLFCLALSAAWWLYQTAPHAMRISRLLGALVVPLLLGVALSQSRIGWMIVPAFAALQIYWNKKAAFKAIPLWLILLYVVFYGVLVVALPSISSMLGVVTDTLSQRTGTGSERLALIQQAWQISLAHPWFGVGWYQFGPQEVALGAVYPRNIYAEHSHNIVMNFAAELGWPITLVIVGLVGYWFFNVCFRRPVTKEAGFAALFFVAVLLHSMTEFPLWYAYVLMPVALLMGMLHHQRFDTPVIRVPPFLVAGLVAVISLGLIGVAADFRRLNLGFQALGFEELKLPPLVGTTAKPDFTLFPYYYDYFQFAKATEREGMPAEEIAFLERVARRFPYNMVMERMANIYALNGRPDQALHAMQVLFALHRETYNKDYYQWQFFSAMRPDIYAEVFQKMPAPKAMPN